MRSGNPAAHKMLQRRVMIPSTSSTTRSLRFVAEPFATFNVCCVEVYNLFGIRVERETQTLRVQYIEFSMWIVFVFLCSKASHVWWSESRRATNALSKVRTPNYLHITRSTRCTLNCAPYLCSFRTIILTEESVCIFVYLKCFDALKHISHFWCRKRARGSNPACHCLTRLWSALINRAPHATAGLNKRRRTHRFKGGASAPIRSHNNICTIVLTIPPENTMFSTYSV